MALLITGNDVIQRLFTVTGVTQPSGLTATIIENQYITGATARILRACNRTDLPGAGEELNELKELCHDMVKLAIRDEFFGLDAEAANAIAKRHEAALQALRDAVKNRAPNVGVQAKVVGGSRS